MTTRAGRTIIGYTTAGMWTAESLSHLATGYWPAATLIAAIELGVFDALDDGSADADALAGRTDGDVDRLRCLLDGLVAIGMLRTAGGGAYALPGELRPLLSRRSPACLLDALAYNADLYRQWACLADVVRGRVAAAGGRQLGGDAAMTGRFVRAMEAKAVAFAPPVAAGIDVGDAARLLDVGSGPGTLSRRLAESRPRLAVTLLDLPAVLEVAREINAASPVAGRLAYHPADYRASALPVGFDAALFAGALHQETPASAAALMAKLYAAVTPGGRVFVVDLMLDDGRTSPAFSALFQINMMLLRPGARVFTTNETTRLLASAGFDDVTATEVDGTPYRIVTGVTRPPAPSPGAPGVG